MPQSPSRSASAQRLADAPPSALPDYDLVIVGGGITGLTLACALQDSGLRIAVVEAQTQTAAIARQQVYAVSLLSSRIFQGIGVWDQILPKIATFRQIRLSDGEHPGVVRFSPRDLGTGALGHVAEHRVLLQALQEHLAQCPTVQWLCPASVTQIQYRAQEAELTLEVEGEVRSLRTRLVIAADGARSRLRQWAGISTKGWQYWQSCITCDVKPADPHSDTAYERFWPGGPFAILPLPEGRCRIVWTEPRAGAEALMALDEQAFLGELQRRYGDQMGPLALAGPRFMFPVQLMHSDRYVQTRLALVGDAAHCCHPVGGQGLNMGIRDAAALAQVLQAAHQSGEDIGSLSVLKRYERWRRWENWLILGFTDILDRLFSNAWLPLVVLRRLGLWLLRTLPPVKGLALRLMTGLLGRSPHLARPRP